MTFKRLQITELGDVSFGTSRSCQLCLGMLGHEGISGLVEDAGETALMTRSCPWSDAAACDHSHPPGELAAKTRKQVTAHASFSLNNFIALVRRIL